MKESVLVEEWKSFWQDYFAVRPHGAPARLADRLRLHPSTIAHWRQGDTIIAPKNIDALLELQRIDVQRQPHPQTLPALTYGEGVALLDLTLRTARLSPKTIQAIHDHATRPFSSALGKTSRWVELLNQLDRELFELLLMPAQGSALAADHVDRYILGLLARACRLFGQDHYGRQLVNRSCVYLPDPTERMLTISQWETQTGSYARALNQWYIGPDPVPEDQHRGIQGEVYLDGRGREVKRVWEAKGFFNPYPYISREDDFPFRHALYIPIFSDGRKVGLLSFDSMAYTFGEQDVVRMSLIAERIGWAMRAVSHQRQ